MSYVILEQQIKNDILYSTKAWSLEHTPYYMLQMLILY